MHFHRFHRLSFWILFQVLLSLGFDPLSAVRWLLQHPWLWN
jgi:hypothetical protein